MIQQEASFTMDTQEFYNHLNGKDGGNPVLFCFLGDFQGDIRAYCLNYGSWKNYSLDEVS